MRRLPLLKDYAEILCPPSSICLSCSKWSDKTGCPEDAETREMAIWGNCEKFHNPILKG